MALCDTGETTPAIVAPPGRVWSRVQVLDWLLAHADEEMLVGFDFSFSAPFHDCGAFLPDEAGLPDAPSLWAYVEGRCDDPDLGATDFVAERRGRHFWLGATDGPKNDYLRWRTCEVSPTGGRKPSTVFDALGAAQVAKASWAGMRLLHGLRGRVPVWPFDPVPGRGMLVVEIYTAIASRAAGTRPGRSKLRDAAALDAALATLGSRPHAPLARYSDHATDAILTSAWLRRAVHDDALWHPSRLTAAIAATEGWTFGVP